MKTKFQPIENIISQSFPLFSSFPKLFGVKTHEPCGIYRLVIWVMFFKLSIFSDIFSNLWWTSKFLISLFQMCLEKLDKKPKKFNSFSRTISSLSKQILFIFLDLWKKSNFKFLASLPIYSVSGKLVGLFSSFTFL